MNPLVVHSEHRILLPQGINIATSELSRFGQNVQTISKELLQKKQWEYGIWEVILFAWSSFLKL